MELVLCLGPVKMFLMVRAYVSKVVAVFGGSKRCAAVFVV